MGILTIKPASKQEIRILSFLYGLPNSGKTLSALKVAAGLEPDPSKRGLLDTEGGSRGQFYANDIDGGYLYGALKPPFTPERYAEAVAEFEQAGVNVLVIDSISHVWDSIGGVLEMVEQSQLKNELARWNAPKKRLKKMVQKIIHSDMHVIMCARAKRNFKEVPDPARPGKTKYVEDGVLPIVEKMLPYDMTFIARMDGAGAFSIASPEGKCPGSWLSIFGRDKVMSEETGKALKEWLGQQAMMTPAQRALVDNAFAKAKLGTEGFTAWAKSQSESDKLFLRSHWDNLKSVAAAADRDEEERETEQKDGEEADSVMDGIRGVSK